MCKLRRNQKCPYWGRASPWNFCSYLYIYIFWNIKTIYMVAPYRTKNGGPEKVIFSYEYCQNRNKMEDEFLTDALVIFLLGRRLLQKLVPTQSQTTFEI